MITSETSAQIDAINIDRTRPLVICDVDEVVVHFLQGLEDHLHGNELWLDPASFALNGNIKHAGTDTPLAADRIGPFLKDFFATKVVSLKPIEGASHALENLSDHADIVMLTNMPDAYRGDRIKNLAGHGMPYPVVVNSGAKGPAVSYMASDHEPPVIFLDDTPNNLHSVADHCPNVILIHFMQDIRFGRHIPEFQNVSLRTDNWDSAHAHILAAIDVNRP